MFDIEVSQETKVSITNNSAKRNGSLDIQHIVL